MTDKTNCGPARTTAAPAANMAVDYVERESAIAMWYAKDRQLWLRIAASGGGDVLGRPFTVGQCRHRAALAAQRIVDAAIRIEVLSSRSGGRAS